MYYAIDIIRIMQGKRMGYMYEKMNQEIPEWILSGKEEGKLSLEEKNAYYEKLREYCSKRKLTNTTVGATVIGPKLKKATNFISRKLSNVLAGGKVKIVTDGIENIPQEAVILATTHQGILDNFVWITDCPQHALIVHGAETNKALLAAQLNTGLILVTKNKENGKKRINAKLDMMTVLLRGHSIWICPETAWNLSPNRLHLPINWGFLDVAQKTGKPIVPMVMEYTYDTSSDKEKITHIHIRYGEPIVVTEHDKFEDKLEEYKEKIATIRWDLIEEKGFFSRGDISNMDYINYLKGNFRNLAIGKINRDVEKNGIQGASQEFYQFHHINDVPWDAWGELCQTDEVERLKRINRVHKI